MPTTQAWRAAATAMAALDCDQADTLLGCELVADIIEAVSSTRGEPYTGDELIDAANALLERRP